MKYIIEPESFERIVANNIVIGSYEDMKIIRNEMGDLYVYKDVDNVYEIGEIIATDELTPVAELPENVLNAVMGIYGDGNYEI